MARNENGAANPHSWAMPGTSIPQIIVDLKHIHWGFRRASAVALSKLSKQGI
jgi:hypothetical protein